VHRAFLGNNIVDSHALDAYNEGMENNPVPQTLIESVRQFSDPVACLNFMIELRWPNGVICPRCQALEPHFISTRKMWRCNGCKAQFSIKVGTIFEDSPLGLDKWMAAVWLIANAKNGISSYEIHRAIKVTQKSAWFMLHRIRLAMQAGTFEKMEGTVEADETFVGGKAKNMHEGKRKAQGRGAVGKTIVMGLLERHAKGSKVKAKVVPTTRKGILQAEVREHVLPGSEVFTDALLSYRGLEADYIHDSIDHAETSAERWPFIP
jgi:transposase-like protein